jgi:predicted Holliday junction resolvase-like endonuclease
MTTFEWILLFLLIILVIFIGLIVYSCVVVGAKADRQMDEEYIEWLKNRQPIVDEKAQKEAEKRKRNKTLADEAQEEMDKAVQDFIARGGLPR